LGKNHLKRGPAARNLLIIITEKRMEAKERIFGTTCRLFVQNSIQPENLVDGFRPLKKDVKH
jgi:hypothetical protein